jgi:hypothetical protein
MKIFEVLTEAYNKKHKCKTPGANYSTSIKSNSVEVKVKLPMKLNLTKKESIDLESDLHYAVEQVLSKFF